MDIMKNVSLLLTSLENRAQERSDTLCSRVKLFWRQWARAENKAQNKQGGLILSGSKIAGGSTTGVEDTYRR